MNEIVCSANAKRCAIGFASLHSCLGRVSIVLDVRGDSDLGVDSKLDEVTLEPSKLIFFFVQIMDTNTSLHGSS